MANICAHTHLLDGWHGGVQRHVHNNLLVPLNVCWPRKQGQPRSLLHLLQALTRGCQLADVVDLGGEVTGPDAPERVELASVRVGAAVATPAHGAVAKALCSGM